MRFTIIVSQLLWWAVGSVASPVAQDGVTSSSQSSSHSFAGFPDRPEFPHRPEFSSLPSPAPPREPALPRPIHPPPAFPTVFTNFQDGSETLRIPVVQYPNITRSPRREAIKSKRAQEYLVLFSDDETESTAFSKVLSKAGMSVEGAGLDHIFDNSIFKGFSGPIGARSAEALNALDSVKLVEPVKQITGQLVRSRPGCPWGLQRISQDGPVSSREVEKLQFTYTFNDEGSMGSGVDIYVLDSGINIDHKAFGNRAKIGFSKDGPDDLDANSDADGHGTHVAGTAAGDVFGVARGANIIGVKVMGADRVGTTADALKGLDYVIKQHQERKTQPNFVGSVASISWSVPDRSQLIERAVDAAVDAGIHVSIAAGNSGQDACKASPAARGGNGAEGKGGKAVTVGSVDASDVVSDFSNTGSCVDVYAPGEAIISTWIGGPDAVEIQDGTSMACPLVSGLMAYMMTQNRQLAQSPALMKEALRKSSVLRGVLPNRQKTPGLSGLMPVVNNGVISQISQQRRLGFKRVNGTSSG